MRNLYTLAGILLCTGFFMSCKQDHQLAVATDQIQTEEKEEGYDGPAERALLEYEKNKRSRPWLCAI